MITRIVNRQTGEVLTVELALGNQVWLRNMAGAIEQAALDQFPSERWCMEEGGAQ